MYIFCLTKTEQEGQIVITYQACSAVGKEILFSKKKLLGTNQLSNDLFRTKRGNSLHQINFVCQTQFFFFSQIEELFSIITFFCVVQKSTKMPMQICATKCYKVQLRCYSGLQNRKKIFGFLAKSFNNFSRNEVFAKTEKRTQSFTDSISM